MVADESDDVEDKQTQTDLEPWIPTASSIKPKNSPTAPSQPNRSAEESWRVYNSPFGGPENLTDGEVFELVKTGKLETRSLEKTLKNAERGVGIRRRLLASSTSSQVADAVGQIPHQSYDYSKVVGACCENVIGYMPLPLGFAGPLWVDGRPYHVPMATTEGCLVASTNRGCSALAVAMAADGSGVRTQLVADGMSRGPVVRLPNIKRSAEVMAWLEEPHNFQQVKESFNATSRFGRLQKIRVSPAGRLLFIRFVAKTGDAMGMNMVSKVSIRCQVYNYRFIMQI